MLKLPEHFFSAFLKTFSWNSHDFKKYSPQRSCLSREKGLTDLFSLTIFKGSALQLLRKSTESSDCDIFQCLVPNLFLKHCISFSSMGSSFGSSATVMLLASHV